MIGFLKNLDILRERWKIKQALKPFGPSTLSYSNIVSESTAPNQTPKWLKAMLDIRTIPHYHKQAYSLLQRLAKKDKVLMTFKPDVPPGYTKKNSPIIKALQKIREPTVSTFIPQIFPAASDMGHFQSLIDNVQAVIWGAGNLKHAHQPNESIDINQVMKSIDILAQWYYIWAE